MLFACLISATVLADRLNVDFALINRNRHKGDQPDTPGKMELLVGDVRDKVRFFHLLSSFNDRMLIGLNNLYRLPS